MFIDGSKFSQTISNKTAKMALDQSPDFFKGIQPIGRGGDRGGFRGEDFLRIVSCPYGASSPHSPGTCLLMYHNFPNNFRNGSPQEHSCELISKSDQRFQRKSIFSNFFMTVQVKKPPFTRAILIEG